MTTSAAKKATATPDRSAPVSGLTPSLIRDVLTEAGCRAEVVNAPDGAEIVSSALHGTGFTVRFINTLEPNPQARSQGADGYSDISLVYMPRIDGLASGEPTPPWIGQAVAEWNASRRFAQLAMVAHQNAWFLVLRWDLLGVGVTRDYLQAVIRLWDQLMQELFTFLRNRAGAVNEADSVQNAVTLPQSEAETMSGQMAPKPDSKS